MKSRAKKYVLVSGTIIILPLVYSVFPSACNYLRFCAAYDRVMLHALLPLGDASLLRARLALDTKQTLQDARLDTILELRKSGRLNEDEVANLFSLFLRERMFCRGFALFQSLDQALQARLANSINWAELNLCPNSTLEEDDSCLKPVRTISADGPEMSDIRVVEKGGARHVRITKGPSKNNRALVITLCNPSTKSNEFSLSFRTLSVADDYSVSLVDDWNAGNVKVVDLLYDRGILGPERKWTGKVRIEGSQARLVVRLTATPGTSVELYDFRNSLIGAPVY